MSSPKQWQFREGDDERLKRVTRYLHGHPDYMQWYQEDTETVVSTTDADWATCKESRRSNSGGTLQLGNHLIAAWSRDRPSIALSSGEAELFAGMRGISDTLGFVHMMREFKTDHWGSDCSSCGCQCMSCHHVETWLWLSQTYHRQIVVVQEAIREYSIENRENLAK